MRIILICQRLFFGRGQEIHVYNLANELAKFGHQVTIFTSDLDSSPIFRAELKLHPNVTIQISKAVKEKYPPNQLLFPNLAEELLALDDIDIIHAHGAMSQSSFIAMTVAKTKKIPFIYTPHFHPWRSFEQIPYRYTREAYEVGFTIPLIHASSRTIAVSPFEKNYLLTRRHIQKYKIKVIPNGINTYYYPSVVSRRKVRERYNIPENKRYLITFGTITDLRKGLNRSLLIFDKVNKELPDTHLIIVGWKYKKHKDHLADLLDTLESKNNISTLGYVTEDEKVALIKMSHILYSPTSYEAFGIILGEAMTLEVPVVVTKVGGTPSIVKHKKTGLTVDTFNSINQFAKYIKYLINNDDVRKAMGKRGKIRVRKYFTWEKIAREVNLLYKTAVAKK